MRIGALRTLLVATVLALIAIGPFSGGGLSFDGLAVITTLVAPAFYVIVLFVLPLDMVMTWVFSLNAATAERTRLRQVLVLEGVLFVLMLVAWAPFVLKLLRLR